MASKANVLKINEKKEQDNIKFNSILMKYLHSIPAHKDSAITIESLTPVLNGIYIVYRENLSLQRLARTISYSDLAELTK